MHRLEPTDKPGARHADLPLVLGDFRHSEEFSDASPEPEGSTCKIHPRQQSGVIVLHGEFGGSAEPDAQDNVIAVSSALKHAVRLVSTRPLSVDGHESRKSILVRGHEDDDGDVRILAKARK